MQNVNKKGYTPYSWAKKSNKPQIIEIIRKYIGVPDNESSANKNQKQKQKVVAQAPPQKQRINERKIPKRF